MLACISIMSMAAGQEDSVKIQKRPYYFFNIQSGILVGCRDCSIAYDVDASFQITHGIVLTRKWRAAVTLGVDNYEWWRTLPLMGTVLYDIAGKRNKLFVEGGYGWAWGWRPASETEPGFHADEGGRCFTIRLGYRLHFDQLNVAMLAGYKSQAVRAEYQFRQGPNEEPYFTSVVEQNFNRFSLMLSVGWR